MRYKKILGQISLVIPKALRRKLGCAKQSMFITLRHNCLVIRNNDGSYNSYPASAYYSKVLRRALWT